MVNVQVEAHADRIGGDQVVHLLRLVQGHLRIARARRQPSMHHGGAAAPVPQQLGDPVYLGHIEGDHGAAARQGAEPRLAARPQRRQARMALDARRGHQVREQRPDRLCAEEPRLRAPASVQQAIGEDVAALRVSRQLDLVDGEEIDLLRQRHRLDRAHPITRTASDALLFAGDQRDRFFADLARHPIVHLARQQPQRQPQHAARVLEHAGEGSVGLAGVRRPQHRHEPGVGLGGLGPHRRSIRPIRASRNCRCADCALASAPSARGLGRPRGKKKRSGPAKSRRLEQSSGARARAGWGARAPRKSARGRRRAEGSSRVRAPERARVGAPARQEKALGAGEEPKARAEFGRPSARGLGRPRGKKKRSGPAKSRRLEQSSGPRAPPRYQRWWTSGWIRS
jgi:hypothetical protein